MHVAPLRTHYSNSEPTSFYLLLHNAECLAEKQQNTNFMVFGLTEPTSQCTQSAHANYYNTDAETSKYISPAS